MQAQMDGPAKDDAVLTIGLSRFLLLSGPDGRA